MHSVFLYSIAVFEGVAAFGFVTLFVCITAELTDVSVNGNTFERIGGALLIIAMAVFRRIHPLHTVALTTMALTPFAYYIFCILPDIFQS